MIKTKRAGVNLDIVVLVMLTLLVCTSTLYMAYMTEAKRGVVLGDVDGLYEIEMNKNDASYYLSMACEESLILTYEKSLNNQTVFESDNYETWFVEEYRLRLFSILEGYAIDNEFYSLSDWLGFAEINFDGEKLSLNIPFWETKTANRSDFNATYEGELSCEKKLTNLGLNSIGGMKSIRAKCLMETDALNCFKTNLPEFNVDLDAVSNFNFISKKKFFYDYSLKPISFVWN
jgi:hypothetical protein